MIKFNQDKIERLIHEILKALTHLYEFDPILFYVPQKGQGVQ